MKNYFKKMKDEKIQQHQYKKVSVVITAYNEEKDIKRAIHSVREYVDEIIVVDDGSTDNTALLAKEEGVIVFQHQFNMGAGAALKSGYKIAFECDSGEDCVYHYSINQKVIDVVVLDMVLTGIDGVETFSYLLR